MVTHEPRAAAIADRVLFLADGLIVKELTDTSCGRGARSDEHPASVTKVALAGLLGRKLRAALTAIAIVLGVAMVSGTYVLTDTIKSAFSTVFTQAYKNTDAVVSGKSAIGGDNNGERADDAVAAGVAARSGPGAARSRRRRRAGSPTRPAGRPEREGDLARRRTRPGVQLLAAGPALQPAHADAAATGRPPRTRSTSTRRPPASTTSRSATRSAWSRAAPSRSSRSSEPSSSAACPRSAARRWRSSRCPPRSSCSTSRASTTRSDVAAKPGTSPSTLVSADQAAAAARQPGQDRSGAGQAGDQGHQRLPEHLPGLPARLRRHRAVRRQLRDREHAVDHGRPAHARAGHAAHARRDPPPGAALGDARGVRDRRARLDRRAVPRASRLAQGLNALLVSFGIDLPSDRHRVQDAHDRRLAARRDRDHAAGGDAAGAARDARAADRRGARGRAAAAVAVGPVRPTLAGVGTVDRRGRADAVRAAGRRAVDRRCGCSSLGVGAVALFIGVSMLAPTLVPPLVKVLGWPATKIGGAAGKLAAATRRAIRRAPPRPPSALMIGLALVTLVGVLAAGLRTALQRRGQPGCSSPITRSPRRTTSRRSASPPSRRCAPSPA